MIFLRLKVKTQDNKQEFVKCDQVMGRFRKQPVVSFLGKTVVISVSSVINVLVTKVISKSDHLFIMHHCDIKIRQMHIVPE